MRRGTGPRGGPFPMVVAVLAGILVIDLIATGLVFLDRRDDPTMPAFMRADVEDVDWKVETYASSTQQLAFTVTPPAPAVVDTAGHVTYRDGALFPSLSATYALAALDEYRRSGKAVWLQRARTAVEDVLRSGLNGFLPHRFENTDVFEAELPRPWFSAQAQGLVLSALARLYEETGDERLRESSDAVFQALLSFRGFFAGSSPAPEPWLSVVDDEGYLWFEQFTYGRAPVKVLANHTRAVLGVYDYARVLADRGSERREARTLFRGGLATVERYLPDVRVPARIAISSLASGERNVADHEAVKGMLGVLVRITGDGRFRRYARLLDKDDDLPIFEVGDVAVRSASVDAYAPLPDETMFTTDPAPPVRVTASGEVTYRKGEINPAVSAGYAIAALSLYRESGRKAWLLKAERAVLQVMATSQNGSLPYRYPDRDVYGMRLPTPWYSAEGQGLMLSALVRLYEVTGQERWRTKARSVFEALTLVRDFSRDGAPPPRRWVSFVDDDGYLWFEQYGGGIAASLVVHAHLSAVIGVYDYWRVTKDKKARVLFDGGVSTIEHWLPKIRRPGRPPWYAVGNKSSDARFEGAVSRQLRTLADITGHRMLARFSQRRAAPGG